MAKIEIEYLIDTHDCETCGTSYAEGARVVVDGEEAFLLRPHAYCYDAPSYSREDVLIRVLQHLGHDISEAETS